MTLTTVSVAVTGTGGVPAGTVAIEDASGTSPVVLDTATLDSTGQAKLVFYLPNGSHSLSAAYTSDGAFADSTSAPVSAEVSLQCDSAFALTVSDLTPATTPANTLKAGQTGTTVVTVIPSQDYVTALGKGPGFITLSCTGLPDQTTCGFTPANLEIPPGQQAGVSSAMSIGTFAASTTSISPATPPGKSPTPIAWALLLPGALGLGGLAWGTRRSPWLRRLSLVVLVGFVTLLATTGCNPRYNYEHHGPLPNPGTPAGTYHVIVTGQSSNGVTATTNSTTLTVTVK